jgi:hypothetical protein
MTRKHESPSKRWFWWTVAVGNVYLAIGFILPFFWSRKGALLDVFMVLYFPARAMLVFFVEPLVTLLTRVGLVSLHAGNPGLAVSTVALSEVAVLFVAVLVHRAAGLFARRRRGNRQEGDGSES